MKKFAVCFSGYPRFIKESFPNIKEFFLDGLGSFDIFANLQWPEEWEDLKIHHEFDALFKENELENFKKAYNDLNLKELKVNPPFQFDTSYYNKTSTDPSLPLNLEQSRDILYRFKSQYQGILDCSNLVKTPSDYEYYIRVRTDLIFKEKIDLRDFSSTSIINQDGFCTGYDRNYSDWFFIVPSQHLNFFNSLSMVEDHFRDGIIHMHKIIEKLSEKYPIEHKEMWVRTPSTENSSYLNTKK
jgi:hypothetical protein